LAVTREMSAWAALAAVSGSWRGWGEGWARGRLVRICAAEEVAMVIT
jgi:hypothetical protein